MDGPDIETKRIRRRKRNNEISFYFNVKMLIDFDWKI